MWTLLIQYLRNVVSDCISSRLHPDKVIGPMENPYMLRYWLVPRNPLFNVYAHLILRSDDDRALHDHPWMNLSIVLDGGYIEVTRDRRSGALGTKCCIAGDWRFRFPRSAHRLEVLYNVRTGRPIAALTLFVTGPRVRKWGFLCPQGWRHWRNFTSPDDSGLVGPGCDD